MRNARIVIIAMVLLATSACRKKPPVAETAPPPPAPVVEAPAPAPPPIVEEDIPAELVNVYFDFDRSDIRSDQADELEANARRLTAYPELGLRIEGHCDERGTTAYNLALGERRAAAARDWLVRQGVASSRITTVSYGEERPADPGHDEGAWARNRRAEFHETAPSLSAR